MQEFMETEPQCLIIRLIRAKGVNGGIKRCDHVSFPLRLDWLRSGAFELAGAIFHHGDTPDGGHYTAACMVDPVAAARSASPSGYVHFNDAETRRIKSASFFRAVNQQRDVYMMLYTRVARREANGGGPVASHAPHTSSSLPYRVGGASETSGVSGCSSMVGLLREFALARHPARGRGSAGRSRCFGWRSICRRAAHGRQQTKSDRAAGREAGPPAEVRRSCPRFRRFALT